MKKSHRFHDWSVLKDDHLINAAADAYQAMRLRFEETEAILLPEYRGRREIESFCCFLWRLANEERNRLHPATIGAGELIPISHLDFRCIGGGEELLQ